MTPDLRKKLHEAVDKLELNNLSTMMTVQLLLGESIPATRFFDILLNEIFRLQKEVDEMKIFHEPSSPLVDFAIKNSQEKTNQLYFSLQDHHPGEFIELVVSEMRPKLWLAIARLAKKEPKGSFRYFSIPQVANIIT